MQKTFLLTLCLLLITSLSLPGQNTKAPAQTGKSSYFTFEPWKKTSHMGDYFSLTREPDGTIAHWKMLNVIMGGKDRKDETVYKSVGKDLYSIPRFGAADMKNGLIKNTMFPYYSKHKPRVRPIITRVGCNRTEDGYFVTCSIGGDYYQKGGTELIPQIFYSKTGAKGTWENLGVRKMDCGVVPGDLEPIIAKARKDKKRIRFETAAVLKINGIYHYYIQSRKMLGGNVCVLQAKDFRGPWKFYGRPGQPVDLTKNLKKDVTWLFFTVISLKDKGYLLVGGNKWPADKIYAAHSTNGLSFQMVSNDPILTVDEVKKGDQSVRFLKSFRGVYNDDGTFEVGVSADTNRGQVMFVSRTKFP